jgi:dTDP-4-amino-4,6-dideoxygalactose transaminase
MAFEEMENVIPPVEADRGRSVYHVYAIRVERRDEVIQQLERKGIGCGVHYPVPVHLQTAYRDLGYERGAFPISEKIADELLSLPMYPELTDAQIDFVVEAVAEAVGSGVMA